MVSMNSTVKFTFHNTATFFGLRVTSTPLDHSFSHIAVCSGTMVQCQLSHMALIDCIFVNCLPHVPPLTEIPPSRLQVASCLLIKAGLPIQTVVQLSTDEESTLLSRYAKHKSTAEVM
ncbi:hypothetical protein L2E82_25015 [Cichorium intybus]|uniref:Uncharacterized protein n=1 Tax=Cichorium intybus TaxID=13427 RepID=A0ACB9E2E2_CICIN|nr:hypothetical protein L2E82_25015 [Cichorium intybus]